jgi:hypothetical protein
MSTLSGKPILTLVAFVAVAVLSSRTHGAEGETVVIPAKRQAALEQAKNLLAPTAVKPGKNPFHPNVEVETTTSNTRNPDTATPGNTTTTRANPPGARSNRDLLQTIATSAALKPSGFFVLGGEPTLVFGQKRVKAGGSLTITFEGSEYTLEIVSIERPNFTLRLNREEFTRPIK